MRTIFKAQSDMVAYSRNATRSCVLFRQVHQPSASVVVAGACDIVCVVLSIIPTTQYDTKSMQSREHQIVHWPSHKAFCKQQTANHELIESHQSRRGLLPLSQRKRLLEDFVSIVGA